jgi:putative transposase
MAFYGSARPGGEGYMHDIYRVSERRACRVARIPVSTFRYTSRQEPALRLRIREIAQTRVRYGYRKIRALLNREGWKWGKSGCIDSTGKKA